MRYILFALMTAEAGLTLLLWLQVRKLRGK
jgi:hypothetical protein